MSFHRPTHQQGHESVLDEELELELAHSRSASLARSASTFQEGEAILSPQAPSLLKALFERMDANKDKGLDRAEVKGYLKAIGVQAGLFGLVHKKVSKTFLKDLDTNKDTVVTWGEFHGVAKNVLPAELFDESGAVDMDLLEDMFAGTDSNASGDLSREEMTRAALEAIPKGTDNEDILADISARFGLDTMDTDASGTISREEMLVAAKEVSRLKEKETGG